MSKKLKFEWELELPDRLFEEGLKEKEFKERVIAKAREEAILELFQEKRISSGKGAALLGISRPEFWELLHKRGMPFFDYSEEEWQKEMETVEELKKELSEEEKG